MAGIILISGCAIDLGEYPALSTKNIQYKDIDIATCEHYPGVVGEDLFLWGLGTTLNGAVDDALEQYNGDFLVDVVAYKEWFPLVYGGYIVKGTVIKVPNPDKDGQ